MDGHVTSSNQQFRQKPGDGAKTPATSAAVNDDARDLAAVLGGDHEAFGRLYDRHAAVVLSICRQRLGAAGAPSDTDAGLSGTGIDDAVQETFIRAYRLLPQLREPAKFRPWLYGIARRVCSEGRRAAGRRTKYEERAVTHATLTMPPGAAPDQDSAQQEQLQRLGDAMDQLEDRERLAIHLYYLDADPVQAASSALGLSRSGYYKLLARARDRLAGLLREVVTP